MNIFTTTEIADYTTRLDQQIQTLIDHQNQVDKPKTNPKSNELIKELHELKKMLALAESSKGEWYKKYIIIYERLFFEQLIQDYTNLIRVPYQYFWLNQSNEQQIDLAKIDEQNYHFPNMGVLSSENFDNLITNDFHKSIRHGSLTYELVPSNGYNYKSELGGREYSYYLTDKSEKTFEILITVQKELIKVHTNSDSITFNFSSAFLQNMLDLINRQQRRAS